MIARVQPATGPLGGTVAIPGDKSISHRALLLGAAAEGETLVHGFVESADCLSTKRCLQGLGVQIQQHGGEVRVTGVGLHGFRQAEDVLDAGNSGTTTRLLSGLLAGQEFTTFITGDDSLRRRPMERIAGPLRQMGVTIMSREGGRLPLAIRGGSLKSIDYVMPVASAQVKSCLLLAGLYAPGRTTLTQPAACRDHTERMLQAMGVKIDFNGLAVSLEGGQQPRGITVTVPGDISSAAYFLVAAAIVSGSEVTLTDTGVNPTRAGILDALQAMGASIQLRRRQIVGGERVADLVVRGASLRAAEFGGAIIPTMIDELPVLAVAATQAEGRTTIRDAAELRVKESDRIATLVTELGRMGARIQEQPDGFIVDGPTQLQGAAVSSYGDHRLAMSLAVAALVAKGDTQIDGAECMAVSYPGFLEALQSVRR